MAAICRIRAGRLLYAPMLCSGISLGDRVEAMFPVLVRAVFREIRGLV